MNKTLIRVLATREGGAVERCHGTPHIGSYSVGSHSFGALSLVLLLHPAPSLDLIKAVAWHDVAERWMGDMPSPIKSNNPELKRVYELIERTHLKTLGLLPDLTSEEADWLLGVDLMDLYLWCLEQERMGCRNFEGWVESLRAKMNALHLGGDFPPQLWAFFQDLLKAHTAPLGLPKQSQLLPRLSDNFNYIQRDLDAD